MWHFTKIPKISHWYWGNPTLPYLRYLTIYSFHKFNPDWEIRFYYPKKYFKTNTWKTFEQKYEFKGKDYYPELKKLPIEFIEFDMKNIGVSNDISEVYKAGFFRQYYLSTIGGLGADMDMIFFKSINDLTINKEENKDTTNITSVHPKKNPAYRHNVSFMLSAPNNNYYAYILEKAKRKLNKKDYQSIGTHLINIEFPTLKSIEKKFKNLKVTDVTIESIYAYDAYVIPNIYNTGDMSRYTKNSIALHWYAGHSLAEKYINEVTHLNYKEYNNVLCKTIRKVYE